ncbi:hypothetical protein BT93_C2030 [Corymbia citriodora subsp. variegata]|nr:hypothetical protein BT93_C2030 [Corymbia citriodora subsp. variegata]
MAKLPSEEQGNSNHAEPPADIENAHVSNRSPSSESEGVSDIENAHVSNRSSSSEFEDVSDIDNVRVNNVRVNNKSASFESEGVLDIENARVSNRLASSQSRGVSDNSKEEVDGPNYRPLLEAASRGDWESATKFFERDATSKTAKITSKSETVLHIAALSAQDQFVENLVELLSPKALEEADCGGRTALHNAVLCGRIRMVKALVTRNPNLTQLANDEGRVPLGISAVEASMHKEIAWFLAEKTTDDGPSHPFSKPSATKTIIDFTYAGHHDIVLYLVGQYPHLTTRKIKLGRIRFSILYALAVMPFQFPSGTRLNVLETLIYNCIPVDLNDKPTDKNSDPVPIIKRIHEVKLRHVMAIKLAEQVCTEISRMSTSEITNFFGEGKLLFEATAKGISEIVKICIQFFPELIWVRPLGKSLPAHAVQFRQERTLGLFLKLSSTAKLSLALGPTRKDSTAMMEDAALYYPKLDAVTNVAGAAFQLQREVQWYKAVESWVIPKMRCCYFKRERKKRKISYWTAFVKEHKDLLEKGEKWVKDTAKSSMLVSTLIATVLFAAAFTVPGGNDNNTGVPLLLGQDSLMIFTISDALGLFSSVTAILLFLAILTSRCEAQDFLYSLPKKIIMGLCFLFLSLAFMLVAFTATLKIVLDKRLEWVLIPITLLASVPVALFVVLQLPLLFQMVKSTYGPSIFRPEGIWDAVKYTEQD